uniref:uncharacterized protein n=1 Tax=Myxine glutinosa TaxID=7769 RepID=UPI00358E822B
MDETAVKVELAGGEGGDLNKQLAQLQTLAQELKEDFASAVQHLSAIQHGDAELQRGIDATRSACLGQVTALQKLVVALRIEVVRLSSHVEQLVGHQAGLQQQISALHISGGFIPNPSCSVPGKTSEQNTCNAFAQTDISGAQVQRTQPLQRQHGRNNSHSQRLDPQRKRLTPDSGSKEKEVNSTHSSGPGNDKVAWDAFVQNNLSEKSSQSSTESSADEMTVSGPTLAHAQPQVFPLLRNRTFLKTSGSRENMISEEATKARITTWNSHISLERRVESYQNIVLPKLSDHDITNMRRPMARSHTEENLSSARPEELISSLKAALERNANIGKAETEKEQKKVKNKHPVLPWRTKKEDKSTERIQHQEASSTKEPAERRIISTFSIYKLLPKKSLRPKVDNTGTKRSETTGL